VQLSLPAFARYLLCSLAAVAPSYSSSSWLGAWQFGSLSALSCSYFCYGQARFLTNVLIMTIIDHNVHSSRSVLYFDGHGVPQHQRLLYGVSYPQRKCNPQEREWN
jgi:hypothetical protein